MEYDQTCTPPHASTGTLACIDYKVIFKIILYPSSYNIKNENVPGNDIYTYFNALYKLNYLTFEIKLMSLPKKIFIIKKFSITEGTVALFILQPGP